MLCLNSLMGQFTSKMGLHHTLLTLFAHSQTNNSLQDVSEEITEHHMAYRLIFFLWEFVQDQVDTTPVCDSADYNKEFMLLSTMSHYRCFITHRSRLNTGWTFPVPLMEAMLRFIEHKAKKSQFSLCSNWFHLQIRISSEVIAFFFSLFL